MFLPGSKYINKSGSFGKNGFSLVEIIVVIAIIGILSALGLTLGQSIQKRSRDAQREADLRSIQSALQQYYADQNKFPNSLATELSNGSALTNCSGRGTTPTCTVSKTYLKKTPKDPLGVAYSFLATPNVSSPTSAPCTLIGGVETGTCHYYYLCGKMENAPSDSTACYDTNLGNFQVTPL